MEHPDNPLLDLALAAIRERAKNTNPIQVEHVAIAVEAFRTERDALAAKVARVEALADRLEHGPNCGDHVDMDCDCGLADLRAALTEGTEG